jgi:hypothetical protein
MHDFLFDRVYNRFDGYVFFGVAYALGAGKINWWQSLLLILAFSPISAFMENL